MISIDPDKFDMIISVEPSLEDINEDGDARKFATTGPTSYNAYDNTSPSTGYDPSVYSQLAFGNTLRSSLGNIGTGWIAEVSDFKKWVVVNMSYHSTVSGRTCSKIFLIVFNGKNGDGMVFSTSNKWRSVSGVDQCASYIRSASSVLRSDADKRI